MWGAFVKNVWFLKCSKFLRKNQSTSVCVCLLILCFLFSFVPVPIFPRVNKIFLGKMKRKSIVSYLAWWNEHREARCFHKTGIPQRWHFILQVLTITWYKSHWPYLPVTWLAIISIGRNTAWRRIVQKIVLFSVTLEQTLLIDNLLLPPSPFSSHHDSK